MTSQLPTLTMHEALDAVAAVIRCSDGDDGSLLATLERQRLFDDSGLNDADIRSIAGRAMELAQLFLDEMIYRSDIAPDERPAVRVAWLNDAVEHAKRYLPLR